MTTPTENFMKEKLVLNMLWFLAFVLESLRSKKLNETPLEDEVQIH